MPEVISASTFRPREDRTTALLTLLTELQREIRAEPGNLGYSINRSLAPDDTALLVIQTFESEDAFNAHGARMAAINAPARIAALITGPLTRPELFVPASEPDPRAPTTAAAAPSDSPAS